MPDAQVPPTPIKSGPQRGVKQECFLSCPQDSAVQRFENQCFRPVLLSLSYAHESQRDLVQMQVLRV